MLNSLPVLSSRLILIIQLVDLMHGKISLKSALGSGTKASFSIPFNKPQYTAGFSPLIEIGSIPERLRSEMSMSGHGSDQGRSSATPPQSPSELSAFGKTGQPFLEASSDRNFTISKADRESFHVLVVEDKYVSLIVVSTITLTKNKVQ